MDDSQRYSAVSNKEEDSTESSCDEEPIAYAEGDEWVTSKEELRMVLVGKTGAGKSATGNTIIKEEVFESRASLSSVTSQCKKQSIACNGRMITVVDTPGLFDTRVPAADVVKEISRCVVMSSTGPHAIIVVLQIGRFTKEEEKAIRTVKRLFGEEAGKYIVIVFTRKDDLKGKPIQEYVQEAGGELKEFIDRCGHRFCAFNNRATGQERDRQVAELIGIIDRMVEKNGGTCYTPEMCRIAQNILQRIQKALQQKYLQQSQQNLITKERMRTIRQEAEAALLEKIEKSTFGRVVGMSIGAVAGAFIGIVGGPAGVLAGASLGAGLGGMVGGGLVDRLAKPHESTTHVFRQLDEEMRWNCTVIHGNKAPYLHIIQQTFTFLTFITTWKSLLSSLPIGMCGMQSIASDIDCIPDIPNSEADKETAEALSLYSGNNRGTFSAFRKQQRHFLCIQETAGHFLCIQDISEALSLHSGNSRGTFSAFSKSRGTFSAFRKYQRHFLCIQETAETLSLYSANSRDTLSI